MSSILLHELGHATIYFICILPLFLFSRDIFNKRFVFIGLLVTIFMDLDHLIDYFIYKGFGFNTHEFLSSIYFSLNGKIYVFFHGWEYALILLILFFSQKDKQKYGWLLFISVGVGTHLLFDALSYNFIWTSYFISNRILRGFDIHLFDIPKS